MQSQIVKPLGEPRAGSAVRPDDNADRRLEVAVTMMREGSCWRAGHAWVPEFLRAFQEGMDAINRSLARNGPERHGSE